MGSIPGSFGDIAQRFGGKQLSYTDLAKKYGATKSYAAPLFTNPNTPKPKGMIQPGNIDLTALPVIDNGDNTYSTVYSTSFNDEKPDSLTFGKEVLLRGILNGRKTDDLEALKANYYKTGKHLGIFDTGENADPYAQQLHQDWADRKIPGVALIPEDDKGSLVGMPR